MQRFGVYKSAPAVLAAITLAGCELRVACPGDGCGTAVVVVGADADLLFPPLTQSTVGIHVSDLIFLSLVDIGMDMNTVGDSGFVPLLADAWTFVDPRTISFHIDTRAKWHDGVRVTAADVAFSFDLYRDTLVNSAVRSLLDPILSVEAADEQTVVFRFSQRYPEQFYDAATRMRILPKHVLDTIPRADIAFHPFARNPIGSGPYRLERWEAGQIIELAADTTFFLGAPGLRRLIWRITPDFATAVTQIVADQADILEAVVGRENIKRVREAPQLRLVNYASSLYGYIGFNLRDPDDVRKPHPLFGDRSLRRALTMAVDREAVVAAVLGEYGEVPVGPTTRMQWIWSESVPQIPFDTASARALLTESGWRDSDRDGVLDRAGRSLSFDLLVPSSSQLRRQAAVIVQDQLKRIGAELKISELEPNLWLTRTGGGDFDAAFGMWSIEPSPRALEQLWTSRGIGGSNHGRYSNTRFDRLVREAAAAEDPETARRMWHEALAQINDDAPAIWLVSPLLSAAVHRRFEGVEIRPDQWAANLWKWRVPADRLTDRDLAGGP